MVKLNLKEILAFKPRRAGFAMTGAPTNINVGRTMRNSHGRRIALQTAEAAASWTRSPKSSRCWRRTAGAGCRGAPADRCRCARNCEAARTPAQADRLCRSGRYPLQPLRSPATAERQCGDVLPHGRVGLDGRTREGSRQALLRAAAPVPQAALRPHRHRLHPPHARGPGGGRGNVLLQHAKRRHRRFHRAGGDAPHHRGALSQPRVEHLCGPGLGRRQLRQRFRALHLAPERASSCGCASISPMSRSSTSAKATSSATTDNGTSLWRAYRAIAANWPNFQMSRIARPAEIYPVFRKLFAKQPASRKAAELAIAMQQRGDRSRLLFSSSDWNFDTLSRAYDAIEAIATRRPWPRRLSQCRWRSSRPSRCSTPIRRSACR